MTKMGEIIPLSFSKKEKWENLTSFLLLFDLIIFTQFLLIHLQLVN